MDRDWGGARGHPFNSTVWRNESTWVIWQGNVLVLPSSHASNPAYTLQSNTEPAKVPEHFQHLRIRKEMRMVWLWSPCHTAMLKWKFVSGLWGSVAGQKWHCSTLSCGEAKHMHEQQAGPQHRAQWSMCQMSLSEVKGSHSNLCFHSLRKHTFATRTIKKHEITQRFLEHVFGSKLPLFASDGNTTVNMTRAKDVLPFPNFMSLTVPYQSTTPSPNPARGGTEYYSNCGTGSKDSRTNMCFALHHSRLSHICRYTTR